jgi:hypothetical protein
MNWRRDPHKNQAEENPVYPSPGSPIAGQLGYVVGICGHRVARSEWCAGFRLCERCVAVREEPESAGIADLPETLGHHLPDPTVAPPRDEVPAPPIPVPPHCNGQHGTTEGCEWCDALAGAITALRHQEAVQRHQEAVQRALDERLRRVEAALGCPGGSAR